MIIIYRESNVGFNEL